MNSSENLARAVIAAALITTRAVEVPSIPSMDGQPEDQASKRLRELTDYVFRTIVMPLPPP